ncbi:MULTISPECIES: metal ABC transporter permease [unclassified Avibacterium]|uniref:metal ABC transporter permease n=1 Tax=unclassified Avibacterium TaxID=2685287 RepID=UPI0020276089|nr:MULTISPECIES: metal ABC transporter permease [unclassified Avibacterium]MCW9698118.1 metal ABC transporter permease [Avibacterium sp. 20-129]URL05563.1 metal ABC transporter permease [Avibacterium sp. 21-595]
MNWIDVGLNWWVEPLSYPFMQNALFMALIIAVICAVLSCFLILKGWSLMGDAISHSILPGIVLAYVASIPLAIGALVSGLCCAFGIGYLKSHSRIKEDTVMGIMFSGMFAVGLVLFSKVETEQHLSHILFGNLLGITPQELVQTLVIATLVLLIILLKRKDFLLFCFDPNHARVIGLTVTKLHYGLLFLLALTIISTMQVVGIILVTAMLISPGITAYVLSKNFNTMLLIAIATATISSFLGVILSYHLDAATGPTIILLQALGFVLALGYRKLRPIN